MIPYTRQCLRTYTSIQGMLNSTSIHVEQNNTRAEIVALRDIIATNPKLASIVPGTNISNNVGKLYIQERLRMHRDHSCAPHNRF